MPDGGLIVTCGDCKHAIPIDQVNGHWRNRYGCEWSVTHVHCAQDVTPTAHVLSKGGSCTWKPARWEEAAG